jgi:hypothetical protein
VPHPPEGIGIIPLFLDIQRGAREEFTTILKSYEPMIAKLAEHEVDIIHPKARRRSWCSVSGRGRAAQEVGEDLPHADVHLGHEPHPRAERTQGEAVRGRSYFSGNINQTFGKYFVDAGFDVLCDGRHRRALQEVGNLSPNSSMRT